MEKAQSPAPLVNLWLGGVMVYPTLWRRHGPESDSQQARVSELMKNLRVCLPLLRGQRGGECYGEGAIIIQWRAGCKTGRR